MDLAVEASFFINNKETSVVIVILRVSLGFHPFDPEFLSLLRKYPLFKYCFDCMLESFPIAQEDSSILLYTGSRLESWCRGVNKLLFAVCLHSQTTISLRIFSNRTHVNIR